MAVHTTEGGGLVEVVACDLDKREEGGTVVRKVASMVLSCQRDPLRMQAEKDLGSDRQGARSTETSLKVEASRSH